MFAKIVIYDQWTEVVYRFASAGCVGNTVLITEYIVNVCSSSHSFLRSLVWLTENDTSVKRGRMTTIHLTSIYFTFLFLIQSAFFRYAAWYIEAFISLTN